MNFKYFILFSIVILTFTSCYKAPSYPNEPVITFGGFEKDKAIYTLGDSGWMYIKFTDGDGDLGILNGDSSSNIFLKNLKDTLIDNFNIPYNIPRIPQKGTSISIDGTIGYKLIALFQPSTYQLYFTQTGKTVDTFSYQIYITDRAQHKSNIITTPQIIVKKQ